MTLFAVGPQQPDAAVAVGSSSSGRDECRFLLHGERLRTADRYRIFRDPLSAIRAGGLPLGGCCHRAGRWRGLSLLPSNRNAAVPLAAATGEGDWSERRGSPSMATTTSWDDADRPVQARPVGAKQIWRRQFALDSHAARGLRLRVV